jgi:ABC-type phosphate/phosphonate transport system substrate-binding protein
MTLRVHNLLADAAEPHYRALAGLIARRAGVEAAEVDRPGLVGLDAILAGPGPALLFLCGLPYVRARDRGIPIVPIAAPVPRGEPAPQYFSELVLREGLDVGSASQLRGRRIGFNGKDSLSGYVLPYWALRARGLAEPLYGGAIETGSHRRSLELLVSGELDAAGIDSTLLALEARQDPAIAALRVLERLGPATVPPVVLLGGDDALAHDLRQVLTSLEHDEEGRAALELGLVERYVPIGDADYDVVREMDGAIR